MICNNNLLTETEPGSVILSAGKQYAENVIEHLNQFSCEMSLSWNSLNVTADIKKQGLFARTQHTYKTLIKNANGTIHPGNMVAVIGASGSGKTTLMTVLANRHASELLVTGSISVGGCKMGKAMKKISGYVFQDDIFLPNLSVMEYLNFVAQLKLSSQVTTEQRKNIIMNHLIALGLQHVKNDIIISTSFGKSKVNLSGGELKRLSVMSELITDPFILFCDEPTTGLDSYSAEKLIKVLNRTAYTEDKIIVCSMHQPNDSIYRLFHQVILLYNGMIIFMGPTEDAVPYFKQYGFILNKDELQASFLIRCLAVEHNSNAGKLYLKLCDEYARIRSSEKSETLLVALSAKIEIRPINWMRKLYVITYRYYLQEIRDPSGKLIYLFQILLVSLLTGSCIIGSVKPTQHGVQALGGILLSLISENLYTPTYAIIGQFSEQIPIFHREYANGVNTPLIFFLSNILSLIPNFVICPTLLTLLFYWFAALKSTWITLAVSCLVTVLVANVSAACGLFLLIICRSENLASMWSNPISYVMMILSGYLIQLRSVPFVMSWINYVNWFKLGLETLFIIQLVNVDHLTCSPNPNLPCFKTGLEVLHHYNFNENDLWPNILQLFALYIGTNTLSFLIFLKTLHSKTV